MAAILLFALGAQAQQPAVNGTNRTNKSYQKKKPAKPSIRVVSAFRPTCNLDSNSVGSYFFPANLGAQWTMRTISQILDVQSKVLKTDTTYSYERVTSDSNRTIQGLPVLRCASSFPYRAGGEDSAKTNDVEYYVDDSVIVAVINHSVSNSLSHILLVNPLRLGASWRDDANDTTRTRIIALDEPVTTVLGTFPHSIVVQSRQGFGELSKYFVSGTGIVKTVYRGISPRENGSLVVTTELTKVVAGDPKRSMRFRFPKVATKPILIAPSKARPSMARPSTVQKTRIKKK